MNLKAAVELSGDAIAAHRGAKCARVSLCPCVVGLSLYTVHCMGAVHNLGRKGLTQKS